MSKLKFVSSIITIASLNLRAGTQFREEMNEEAVADYAALYKTAKEQAAETKKDFKNPLPKIKVVDTGDEKGLVPVDGYHRIKGAKGAKLDEFEVDLAKGTYADAMDYALGVANIEHGVRLTSQDKKNKLDAALKLPHLKELSGNALAKAIGVSEFFIRANRPVAETPKEVTVTRKGKKIKLDTKNIGKKGGKTKKPSKKAAAAETPALPGTELSDEEKENLALGIAANADQQAAKKAAFDDDTEKAINKIIKAIDGKGFDGENTRNAIKDGSLKLSAQHIKIWATTSDQRILHAAPLVIHNRMTPVQAYALLDRVPDEKTRVEDFINLAIAKGVAQEKVNGTHLISANAEDFKIIRNVALGVYSIVPKGIDITVEKA